MIKLHHRNGEAFLVNADLVKFVEARPETFVTLTSGDRLMVRETMEEVLTRALEYQRSKHLIPA